MDNANDIVLLAQMLKMAAEERDKASAIRQINRLGLALNRMAQQVLSWQGDVQDEGGVEHENAA